MYFAATKQRKKNSSIKTRTRCFARSFVNKKLDERRRGAHTCAMDKKMKIAVLDGYTTTRDDLDWSCFAPYAEVVAFDRTPKDKIVERALEADAVFTNKVPMFAEQLDALPKLKYIGVLATGFNNIDVPLCAKRGIAATNIPAYSTDSVAQEVFAHILNISNRVALHAQSVRRGDWCKSPDICYCLAPQTELAGKTLGIVGFGAIGRKVAQIARAFSMNVVAFSPSKKAGDVFDGVRIATLDEVFSESDIVSLNCPLKPETDRLIRAENIAKFRRGAWLVNTGRGGLVDERDLAEALQSGQIAYAGLDVLSTEPPPPDNPLLKLENCFITPHIAWTTSAARRRLVSICLQNFRAWLGGERLNRLD